MIFYFTELHFIRAFLAGSVFYLYIEFCCPGKEALGIIVVSLTCTAYHWETLIVLWVKASLDKIGHEHTARYNLKET